VSAEADLLQQRGDDVGVAHRLGHALALLQEARRRRLTPEPELESLVRSVEERLARRAISS
jgi:hypothetical protein